VKLSNQQGGRALISIKIARVEMQPRHSKQGRQGRFASAATPHPRAGCDQLSLA